MGTQQCTQIGENGFSAPFLAIRVHCCYELRCKLRRELRRELRRVARAPQPPWCAGDAPSVVASPLVGKPLVGKTGSARVVPPLGLRLR